MDKNKLKCMFCGIGQLINGSFSDSPIFVYLTCNICLKRQICLKEDYNQRIMDHKAQDLNKWV